MPRMMWRRHKTGEFFEPMETSSILVEYGHGIKIVMENSVSSLTLDVPFVFRLSWRTIPLSLRFVGLSARDAKRAFFVNAVPRRERRMSVMTAKNVFKLQEIGGTA
jgi:hypothetical protein